MGKKVIVDVTTPSSNFVGNNDLVNAYLKEVKNFSKLSQEEEKELFIRYKNGDDKAREQIINSYQLFVFAIAKKFNKSDIVMDLVNEGNIGLIEAMENFDPEKGNRFISYAVHYIRRNISAFILKNDCVRRTNNDKNIVKLNKVRNDFMLKEGRYPDVNEIMDIFETEYGIKVRDESYLYNVETMSIDTLIDEDTTFADTSDFTSRTSSYNEYETNVQKDYAKALIQGALSGLKKKDADIMKYLYGIDNGDEHTLEETGLMFGCTSERIRQIRRNCLSKMRKSTKAIQRQEAV